ncbi:MAG: EamA family transporter RarD [Spirochaetales bacterium]
MIRDRSLAFGTLAAFVSFLLWGLLPFYWKGLEGVPALEVLGHRVFWSALLLAVLVPLIQRRELREAFRSPKALLLAAGAGLLVGANWFVYNYSVASNRLVEASLGYYINPLVSIALGVVVLKERLSKMQVAALVLAAVAVVLLSLRVGRFPWISLTLAISFGLYGLIKKTNILNSLVSLLIELVVLAPVALGYLVFLTRQGDAAFAAGNLRHTMLLAGAGIATVTPLLLFGAGARRIPLSRVGFLQYLAPTLMLLIGTLIYNEAFTWIHAVSFALIWIALAIYMTTILRGARADRPAKVDL